MSRSASFSSSTDLVLDRRAPEIYVNLFSGEATTEFPAAMQMARGGVSAMPFPTNAYHEYFESVCH